MTKQKLWRGASSSKTSQVARSGCRCMLSTLREEEFRPQHQRERHLAMVVKSSEREPCKEADLLNLASPRLSVGVPGWRNSLGPGSGRRIKWKKRARNFRESSIGCIDAWLPMHIYVCVCCTSSACHVLQVSSVKAFDPIPIRYCHVL